MLGIGRGVRHARIGRFSQLSCGQMRLNSFGNVGAMAAATPQGDSLEHAQAIAVDALCQIGEAAIAAAGGVRYVADPRNGLACEVRLHRGIVAETLGASIDSVLDSGRNRLHLSHSCYIQQVGSDGLSVAVRITENDSGKASQILSAELGLLSLLSRYKAPRYGPTFDADTQSMAMEAGEEEFEAPRLPVP